MHIYIYPDHPIWQTVATCGKKLSSGIFCQMSGSSGKIPHLAKFCRISGKTRLLPDIWQKPTHLAKFCQMGFCMIRGVNHW